MNSWGIRRADTVSGNSNIKLNRGPVRDATGRGNGSAARSALKLVDFQSCIRERQNSVAILQPNRQVTSGEGRIHDLDLSLYVRI